MTDISSEAEHLARSKQRLRGATPRARRISAQILVNVAERQGKGIEQWIVDVAEGRLPA